MADVIIRPTAKFLKAGAIAAGLVFLALEIAYFASWQAALPHWFPVIPPLVLLWPAIRAIRRHYTKAVIAGDRLRYETGMTAKSTRNIQLTKLQDVRVDQRVMQRIFNVGDLSIETAGETSRLTIFNVDSPQRVADEIMSRGQTSVS